MIKVLYQVVDENGLLIGNPFSKTFSSYGEQIAYEQKQDEHPYLFLQKLKEIKN